MNVMRVIGYAFVGSVAASLIVMLGSAFAFGFQLGHWAEWQGRIVGVAGTIAGIAGAVFGLKIGLRTARQAVD
jgi:hypothetical protein